jgi:hypothetical protein
LKGAESGNERSADLSYDNDEEGLGLYCGEYSPYFNKQPPRASLSTVSGWEGRSV